VIIPGGKTVTLDANNINTANSYFIKIYGVLQFTGSSKIDMSNSSRVYIFTGGSITGTSPSQALRINGSDKYKGSEGTVSGSKYAASWTSTSPNGFVIDMALPVKYVGFNVARQNNNVLIDWTTSEEINSSHYLVQRSENGSEWNTIATVTAAGTNLTHTYSYTDKNVTARVVYYRICQVDIDGKTAMTPVRVVRTDSNNGQIKVAGSSSNSVYVHFSEQVKTTVTILVASSNGQVISKKTIDSPVGQVIVPAQNLTKGVYIISVTDGQDLKFSKQVLF
jgi:hypothetical protein